VKVAWLTPGGLLVCHELPASQGAGMGGQKSAEAVVAADARQRRAELELPIRHGTFDDPTRRRYEG